jgi:hypothetical protein
MVCTEGEAESIIGNEIYNYYEINDSFYRCYLENLIQDMLCQSSSLIPIVGDNFIPLGAVVMKDGEYLSETDDDTLDGFILLKCNNINIKKKISYDGENINFEVYVDGDEKAKENIQSAFSYMLENNADVGISEFIRKNDYDLFEKYSQNRQMLLQNCRLDFRN